MSIFPIIQPQISDEVQNELKLYKEVKWDYDNKPVFINGRPKIVTGKEAVLVWAWKALRTQRYRYGIYSWDYGSEIEELIGQPYTEELKKSEAERFIRECLQVNPYITDITNISVSFVSEVLNISCTIETVYGEVDINV